MTAIIDKALVKQALKELIQEDPVTFKALLKEVLNESFLTANQEEDVEIEQLIYKNFDRYSATFKALA
ncbi:hypothetical protein [Runella sp.]|jgi:hypothetical protein|uniref:hypothetical protein n=1 Tax=Runella sp. TaxID=1960881 RepID=UPI002624D47E|nr:hypothetical protein [Runella sp.]